MLAMKMFQSAKSQWENELAQVWLMIFIINKSFDNIIFFNNNF